MTLKKISDELNLVADSTEFKTILSKIKKYEDYRSKEKVQNLLNLKEYIAEKRKELRQAEDKLKEAEATP